MEYANSIANALFENPVHYNHLGYVPGASKIFFVDALKIRAAVERIGKADLPDSLACVMERVFFRVVDVAMNASYRGKFSKGTFENSGICEYTGEQLWTGDFSHLDVEGTYFIQIAYLQDGEEKLLYETETFDVSSKWILMQLKANIKSFYFQRTGVELTPEFAGKWARPAAHFDNQLRFHHSMNREGTWDAHGGWYDAGDYGKYIVNGGVSVGTLLLACELCDGKADDFVNVGGTFELPFGLKDEVRFELEFFLRMQDDDGGVFFKVTPEHWDGFVSPCDSDLLQKRLILGKSTSSTLNFAGVMAWASKVYRSTDADFAEQCLLAALKAYRWAVETPYADWPHNTEGSGGYGDECVTDEFFWVRALLYREMGEGRLKNAPEGLREQLFSDMEINPPKLGLDWRDTQNFGWIALALQSFDQELQARARAALEKTAAEVIALQKQDAYGLSIRKFIWGSNGDVSNHGLTLAVVRTWTPTLNGESLERWCLEQLNFVYGRNPMNRSFVTGSAWSSPRFPHHRLSHSDGVDDPIPGLLVGGINCDRQDTHRAPHYLSPLPGYSYTDERCSFASNETAINWNSPLTALLALLS